MRDVSGYGPSIHQQPPVEQLQCVAGELVCSASNQLVNAFFVFYS